MAPEQPQLDARPRRASSRAVEKPPIAGRDGRLDGGVRCIKCDRLGHAGPNCPAFGDRARGALPWCRGVHSDAAGKSAAELAAVQAAGSAPEVLLVDGRVVVMSGRGLNCWYNTFNKGLEELQINSAPASLAALRSELADFLQSDAAKRVKVGSTGLSLDALLRQRGATLAQLASAIRSGVAARGGAKAKKKDKAKRTAAARAARTEHSSGEQPESTRAPHKKGQKRKR